MVQLLPGAVAVTFQTPDVAYLLFAHGRHLVAVAAAVSQISVSWPKPFLTADVHGASA